MLYIDLLNLKDFLHVFATFLIRSNFAGLLHPNTFLVHLHAFFANLFTDNLQVSCSWRLFKGDIYLEDCMQTSYSQNTFLRSTITMSRCKGLLQLGDLVNVCCFQRILYRQLNFYISLIGLLYTFRIHLTDLPYREKKVYFIKRTHP